MSKTCVVQEECCAKMTSATNTVQSERSTIDHSPALWPFLLKSENIKRSEKEKQNSSIPPSTLLRTSSLDRIRQFPAYLCRRGSNSVLFWLYNSRSAFREVLTSAHIQLRGLFLALCVYLAIGLIVAQFVVCCLVMSIAASSLPSGFIFMIVCIVMLSIIGMKTIPHDREALLHT